MDDEEARVKEGTLFMASIAIPIAVVVAVLETLL
jgi:hypothetical protein